MPGEDITIKKNWDESRNERVIIIYGDSFNDNQNRNGQIEIISSKKENNYYHYLYLKAHAKTNYITDKQYQNCIEQSQNTLIPAIAIFIQNDKYNNIIFTETTQENSDNRYGILYFPTHSPSEEQYQSFNQLKEKLKDFKEILVYAAPYINDGILDNEISFIMKQNEMETIDTKIKELYKNLETTQSHRKK